MEVLDEKISSGADFNVVFQDAVLAPTSKIITFVNPYSYEQLKNRHELIIKFDYLFSDGSLLCFFHNIFKKRKITRASFDYSSVANYVFQFAAENSLTLAIVGATDDELVLAVAALTSKHKNLNVVFSRNGYFNDNNGMMETVELISNLGPDLVIVGMGTPFQEEFSVLIKDNFKKAVVILTCGGFLTQTAVSIDYYLPLINRLGLRWLQRAVMQKHVRARLLKDYPKFMYNYVKSNVFKT